MSLSCFSTKLNRQNHVSSDVHPKYLHALVQPLCKTWNRAPGDTTVYRSTRPQPATPPCVDNHSTQRAIHTGLAIYTMIIAGYGRSYDYTQSGTMPHCATLSVKFDEACRSYSSLITQIGVDAYVHWFTIFIAVFKNSFLRSAFKKIKICW